MADRGQIVAHSQGYVSVIDESIGDQEWHRGENSELIEVTK